MMWQSEFTGPTWNFAWIRKANVMLDRVSARMKDILTEEQYNHWMGIGRFFRGMGMLVWSMFLVMSLITIQRC